MKEDQNRLNDLSSSIEKAKTKLKPYEKKKAESSQAFRVLADILAGVLLGCLIGYNIDGHYDSFPIFFLICFAFGIAGSAMNIYRSFSHKS